MEQFWINTIWLIPCYPLVGAVVALVWFPGVTRRTGPRPAAYLNLLLSLLAFAHSCLAWSGVWQQPALALDIPWLQVGDLNLSIPLEVSSMTTGACVLVIGLNVLTQLYAIGYMEMDWGWARFFSLLGVFEAGMCSLALCNSLFFSYIALEILTLATYLLVGFWFNQPLVITGARDAFLTKRVGDLLLLIGVITVYPLVGSWNFDQIQVWAESFAGDPALVTWVGLALIAGPMGKCAQFPLHLWLDEAMEGPIPSTVLRNSVVVSTGAWVLIKLEPFLDVSPVVRAVVIAIGVISAVGGTAIALAQTDVKRALSYSVSAYLGIIFIAVGAERPDLGVLLLLTYAVGMALVLMSVGSVVWNSVTQDLGQMGGLWSRRPISGLSFLVGSASLVALPPLGCFWPLAELCQHLAQRQSGLLLVVIIGVSAGTACSLMRVFGLIWGGPPQAMTERSPEVHWPMMMPMTILLGFALHVPLVLQYWQLLPSPASILASLQQVAPDGAVISLMVTTLVGLGLGSYLYLFSAAQSFNQVMQANTWSQSLQELLANGFYTASVYRSTFVWLVRITSLGVALLDRYFVDGIINVIGLASTAGGEALKYTASGRTQAYLLTILVGLLVMGVVMWRAMSLNSL